ncbi:universal stress protein [Klenkia terrae]|uniref:universal stress protein n=1 Tax=Klenkia terrae TaxID=1052259 RepID=UPI00361EF529
MTHAEGPVVAAVDHTPGARATVRAAAIEAARRRTPLRLVHVHRPVRRSWFAGPAATDLGTTTRWAAEDLLQAIGDLVPSCRVDTVVRTGHPAELLVDETVTSPLVVLGGRSGSPTGVGSTAARVVAHAAGPVLVLPDEDDRALVAGRSVVVGVSGGPGDEAVLQAAFEEADARGCELVAVHTWIEPALEPTYQTISPLIDWDSVRDEEQRLLAEALAGLQEKWPGTEVRPALIKQRPAPGLCGAASTAELLVVGHRHHGRVPGLGSTTRSLLHQAPCPVLVVPVAGRSDHRTSEHTR